MIWPRTRGAMPTTFARAIASSVRGWRSTIFQTRRISTAVATITVMLMIHPAGFRHSFGGRVFTVGAEVEVGCRFSGGEAVGVIGVSMEFQFLKQTSQTVSVNRMVIQR